MYDGARRSRPPDVWRAASPLFHVGPDTPPLLFIGSGQPRFSVGRDAMVGRLRALGIPHRVVVLPDTPHGFWLFDPWLDPTVDAAAPFQDAHLRPRRGHASRIMAAPETPHERGEPWQIGK